MKNTKNTCYLVTAAEYGATPHRAFLANLKSYAKLLGAKILVMPMGGQNKEDMLHPDITSDATLEIVATDLKLTRRLGLKQFHMKAQQINPLTGLNRHVQADGSAIVASPKQFFKPCANSLHELPKLLLSTGACTLPNYKEDSRIGAIAEHEHVIGAVFVETLEDDKYHVRQIEANSDGSFIDLGRLFAQATAANKAKTNVAVRAEALILGDWHNGVTSLPVIEATRRMIAEMQPKHLVIHDLFDGQSVNHHEAHMFVRLARKFDKLQMEAEVKAAGEALVLLQSMVPADCLITVVKANHDEFLDRYLQSGVFGNDARNILFSSKLVCAMGEGKDPLEEGIFYTLGRRLARVRFLQRDQDFKVWGYQLGAHGDLGANGSKATVAQLETMYGPSFTGHRHTPEKMRNVFVVGTSTELQLDYNRGPSSWMNTHGVIYPNKKGQLINIIEGKYKA